MSNEILDEYQEIVEKQTTAAIAENIMFVLMNQDNVNYVNPHFRLALITPDPDDNKFVDCAFAANADYIVSDDRHFDVLKRLPFPQFNVVSMSEFLNQLINTIQ